MGLNFLQWNLNILHSSMGLIIRQVVLTFPRLIKKQRAVRTIKDLLKKALIFVGLQSYTFAEWLQPSRATDE